MSLAWQSQLDECRRKAIDLAERIGVEIEALPENDTHGTAYNVWPPKGLPDKFDPLAGDHYCTDWYDVLECVETYAEPKQYITLIADLNFRLEGLEK